MDKKHQHFSNWDENYMEVGLAEECSGTRSNLIDDGNSISRHGLQNQVDVATVSTASRLRCIGTSCHSHCWHLGLQARKPASSILAVYYAEERHDKRSDHRQPSHSGNSEIKMRNGVSNVVASYLVVMLDYATLSSCSSLLPTRRLLHLGRSRTGRYWLWAVSLSVVESRAKGFLERYGAGITVEIFLECNN